MDNYLPVYMCVYCIVRILSTMFPAEAVQGAIFDSSGDLWDIGTTCETICEYILQYVCNMSLFFFQIMNNLP